MKKQIQTLTLTILFSFIGICGAADTPSVNAGRYNVVWDAPSTNATGSMPLSGGNLGLNVWVEGDDLLFYIGHPDSRVEDERLVKLGRVRISLDSNPFRKNFRQELDLAQSCIRVTGDGVALNLWIDAFQPVIHVEMQSDRPVTARVAYESWRFQAKPMAGGLEWVYRLDPAQDQRLSRIKRQKAEAIADKIPDPLKNLTFGGRIVADGLVADGEGEGTYMKTAFRAWKMRTAQPVSKLDLRVLLRVAQDDTVEAWRAGIDTLQKTPSDRQKTAGWWRGFWNRSWIVINPDAKPDNLAWQAGRNYQLFRYILAANRTGKFPTLFNGGIFTFDNPMPNPNAYGSGGPSPDCRAWWGCHFMAQNQRLVYWPMLKAGDLDLLDVALDFYRDREPVARAKAKHFQGVDGTLFTESLEVSGLIAACQSGNGLESARHLTHHFTSGLEFAYMMLEECRYDGRDIRQSLPVMMGMLQFYDNLYQKECQQRTGKPLDANGKLVFYPGNACEMGAGCTNHADAVAGLWALTDGLLRLPGSDRHWLDAFRQRLPAIPVAEKEGRRIIPMAESWEEICNPNEFPQMYAVFPFHRYGVGLPELELARDTWRHAAHQPANQKEVQCWKYDNIAVADLGMTLEAKEYCLRKLLYPFGKNGGKGKDGNTVNLGNCAKFTARYPAFYVCYPFDHFPDMDHGGSAMIGLQEMLLQCPGKQILLFPAWPKEWDVSFKLHAPKQTTVEGELRGGKVIGLKVTPESRKKDVTICPLQEPPTPPVSENCIATASTEFNADYSAGKALDSDPDTRWSAARGQAIGWLEVDLGKPIGISRAVIQERSYPQTTRFALEAKNEDGSWKVVAEGDAIGFDRELKFTPCKARIFRLNIKASKLVNAGAGVTMDEFKLFEK